VDTPVDDPAGVDTIEEALQVAGSMGHRRAFAFAVLLALGSVATAVPVAAQMVPTGAQFADVAASVSSASPGLHAQEIEVDVRDLPSQLGAAPVLSLSPDGAWIATAVGGFSGQPAQLCVLSSATFALRSCTDLAPLGAGLWRAVWSPDGDHLALIENWARVFLDGDLWLVDAVSGTLINLDDDGYRGPLPGPGSVATPVTLPDRPAFSADGRSLAYLRTTMTPDDQYTDLVTVGLDGGEPREVVRLTDGTAFGSALFTPDGTGVIVALDSLESGGSMLALVTLAGGELRTIRSYPEAVMPEVEATTPDGRYLLVADVKGFGTGGSGLYSVVDTSDGSQFEVTLPASMPSEMDLADAALSPDGSRIVGVTLPTDEGSQIVFGNIADVVAHQPLRVALADGVGSQRPTEAGAMTWASNDEVMLPGAFGLGPVTLLRMPHAG
jgi:WD40-like Beta Propeller Repeat